MATSIYLPWHDLALRHRDHITVAPRPMRLRFDSWNLARDGHAPPVYAADPSLAWLADFVRDGWEVSIGKPLREMIERGAALLNINGNTTRSRGAFGGGRTCGPIGGAYWAFNANLATPFFVITSYSTAGVKPDYTIPDNYRFAQGVGVGGGGSGGRGSGSTPGAGGGGGGCGSLSALLRPHSNGVVSVTVGAGGTMPGGSTAGNPGDPTTITGTPFSGATLTANGGSGGGTGSAAAGGAGGTATGGDSNNSGGAGGAAGTGDTSGGGGGGAGGPTGAGGAGGAANNDGSDGTNTGGGGGAGGQTGDAGSQSGGAGGGGINSAGGSTPYVVTNALAKLGGNAGGAPAFVSPAKGGTSNPGGGGGPLGYAGGLGGGGGGGGYRGNNSGVGGVGTAAILVAA